MKKARIFLFLILVSAAAVGLAATACKKDQTAGKEKKCLIVYYSKTGNTAVVAKAIGKLVNGDIFEIETVNAYPEEYKATTEQAKKEQEEGYRPPLKNSVANIQQYDTIILGSPCWWGTVATPVMTFLESYDFSGKTIAPFITHGGSRLGKSVEDIKKMCPKATVTEGFSVFGVAVKEADVEAEAWLKRIGIKK